MTRTKLYVLLVVACLAGYGWVFYQMWNSHHPNGFSVCLFKETTGLPCPSCGTTRSVLALAKGRILDALYYNPLGLILAVILLITPYWLIIDIVAKTDSLLRIYTRIEEFFRVRIVALIAAVLILANWMWNIYKEL